MKFCFGFILCLFLVSSVLLTEAEAQSNSKTGTAATKHTNNSTPAAESKQVSELKRSLKEKDQKIEDLNKALQQQNIARKDLEELFVGQRKLLLDEQQKLVEELVNKRQQMATFVSENTRSSEREGLLARELEQSIWKESEATKKIAGFREAQVTIEDLIRANKSLKNELADKESELASVTAQKQTLDDRLKTAASDNEKQSALQSGNNVTIAQKDSRIEQLQSELNQANQIVKALQLEVEAKKQLEAKVQGLDQELTEARNLIMLKETELKILNESGTITSDRLPNTRNNPSVPSSQNTNPYNSYVSPQRRVAPAENAKSIGQAADLNSDVMVVTVIEDKVNLRSGPGNEHAPVMQVQRGSRLTVETRQGDWYSVITPTGSRAFVHRDFVTSGQLPSNPAKPISRALSSMGDNSSSRQDPNSDDERRAFEALRNNFVKPQ